jgi:hypothetical protein
MDEIHHARYPERPAPPLYRMCGAKDRTQIVGMYHSDGQTEQAILHGHQAFEALFEEQAVTLRQIQVHREFSSPNR